MVSRSCLCQLIHDFRYHMWIPELKDQLNSGQCLLKIGPDHVQKSGGRFSENYSFVRCTSSLILGSGDEILKRDLLNESC